MGGGGRVVIRIRAVAFLLADALLRLLQPALEVVRLAALPAQLALDFVVVLLHHGHPTRQLIMVHALVLVDDALLPRLLILILEFVLSIDLIHSSAAPLHLVVDLALPLLTSHPLRRVLLALLQIFDEEVVRVARGGRRTERAGSAPAEDGRYRWRGAELAGGAVALALLTRAASASPADALGLVQFRAAVGFIVAAAAAGARGRHRGADSCSARRDASNAYPHEGVGRGRLHGSCGLLQVLQMRSQTHTLLLSAGRIGSAHTRAR
ncbi:hypothetical protein PFISCL1PPCAC_11933, partial [Pristionchus fissidentatus]